MDTYYALNKRHKEEDLKTNLAAQQTLEKYKDTLMRMGSEIVLVKRSLINHEGMLRASISALEESEKRFNSLMKEGERTTKFLKEGGINEDNQPA